MALINYCLIPEQLLTYSALNTFTKSIKKI